MKATFSYETIEVISEKRTQYSVSSTRIWHRKPFYAVLLHRLDILHFNCCLLIFNLHFTRLWVLIVNWKHGIKWKLVFPHFIFMYNIANFIGINLHSINRVTPLQIWIQAIHLAIAVNHVIECKCICASGFKRMKTVRERNRCFCVVRFHFSYTYPIHCLSQRFCKCHCTLISTNLMTEDFPQNKYNIKIFMVGN